MATIRKVLVNPQRPRPAAKKRFPAQKARRKNPGTLTVLGLLNPQKVSSMKKNSKKRATPRKRIVKRASNPVSVRRIKARPVSRRRNPNGNGIVSKGMDFAKTGIAALVGLVATRQIPQMALGSANTGAMGYGANVATAIVAAALSSKFAGKTVGTAVGIGGALYVANRLITDYLSPVGKVLSLSGLGDAMAAEPGQPSGVRPAHFMSPETYDATGAPMLPPAIERRISAAGAPPAAKLAGLRFQ